MGFGEHAAWFTFTSDRFDHSSELPPEANAGNRFYGRATYDFSDATMISIAQPIATRRPDDALALLNAQLEFNPRSAKTLTAIAYAYTRKLDDTTAITYLEKALEIEPENGAVQGQLEQLKSYRRKK